MVTPQHIGSVPSCLLLHHYRMFGGGKQEKVTPPISVPYVTNAETFSHYLHTALHLLASPGSRGDLQLKGHCMAVGVTEGNRFRPARLTHCPGLGTCAHACARTHTPHSFLIEILAEIIVREMISLCTSFSFCQWPCVPGLVQRPSQDVVINAVRQSLFGVPVFCLIAF